MRTLLPLLALALVAAPAHAQGRTRLASCCPSPGTEGPCCIGQWDPVPYLPPISCAEPLDPACGSCASDEISHAALIPAGEWPDPGSPGDMRSLAGMVLVWTRCPTRSDFTTHVWDPGDPWGIAYSPPILAAINDGASSEDRPFCAGHAWILDDQENPKLLTVGGEDWSDSDSTTPEAFEDQDPNLPGLQNPCTDPNHACGLHKVYWFDPLTGDPATAWSDAPPDLTDGRWYPSVTTYLNADGTAFLPLVLGGGPSNVLYQCGAEFSGWWTLDRPLGGPWVGHASGYPWHNYPRTFQTSGPATLIAGNSVLCEDEAPGNPFGGNPSSVLSATNVWSPGPSPNPDDTTLDGATGGAWNYSNGVVLHTLKTRTYTEVAPELNYDLDRVLITGGSQQAFVNGSPGPIPAQPYTHELFGGAWTVKAAPVTPRVHSNWVVLPDGSVLLLGGASSTLYVNAQQFHASIERFTPERPQDPGVWKTMAPRPDVVVSPAETLPPPARGYHSVAVLLQDGRVALMGGVRPNTAPYDRPEILPWSRVEIYNPSYTFERARPRISATQGGAMQYGVPFHLTVDQPERVAYACLIGISSITHAFDYGQRYVELMAAPAAGPGNLKVLGPPVKTSAPEGYYLLFVVELRAGVRVPSRGVFVKLAL